MTGTGTEFHTSCSVEAFLILSLLQIIIFDEFNKLTMICVACNNTKCRDTNLRLDGVNLEMFNFVVCLELVNVRKGYSTEPSIH